MEDRDQFLELTPPYWIGYDFPPDQMLQKARNFPTHLKKLGLEEQFAKQTNVNDIFRNVLYPLLKEKKLSYEEANRVQDDYTKILKCAEKMQLNGTFQWENDGFSAQSRFAQSVRHFEWTETTNLKVELPFSMPNVVFATPTFKFSIIGFDQYPNYLIHYCPCYGLKTFESYRMVIKRVI